MERLDDWLVTWWDSKWCVPSLVAFYVTGFTILGICLFNIL